MQVSSHCATLPPIDIILGYSNSLLLLNTSFYLLLRTTTSAPLLRRLPPVQPCRTAISEGDGPSIMQEGYATVLGMVGILLHFKQAGLDEIDKFHH